MNSDYLIIKERYAMKLADMLVKTEYEIIYGDTEKKISGIEFDSRNCVPGSMFVAVSGFETDGNRFIDKAIENGAVAILSDKNPEKQYPNLSYIKVNDARKSMSEVASVYYREPSKEIKVIGITGTNGKTSTAYFLKNILEHCGKKVGIIGTLGNYFNDMQLKTTHTTPESVEVQRLLRDMADKGAEFVVMEVSSHGLELFRVEDVKFSGGVFTNLTQDHLDFHKTMEEYYLAKRKLFDFNLIYGVVNVDDEYGARLYGEKSESGYKLIGFGFEKRAGAKIKEVCFTQEGTSFVIDWENEQLHCNTNQIGTFNVYNISAAILAAINEGLPSPQVIDAVRRIQGVPGRLEKLDIVGDYGVVIDFAHTPDGLKNILSVLRPSVKGRIITVFGCGGNRDAAKRAIMGEISGRLSDFTILTSDNPRWEDPEKIIDDIEEGILKTDGDYVRVTDRRKAIEKAVETAKSGDMIILAGKGHEMWQVYKDDKVPFDERKIIKEIIGKHESHQA